MVKLVDDIVFAIETEKGEKIDYVNVQLNPPDGPVGRVVINLVDFSNPVEEV